MNLVLMSFLVGFVTGLTGMGGAALMTPFLMLIVGVRPLLAVGTDLAYGAITKISGAAVHFRANRVDLPTTLNLAVGSVPGGIFGFFLLQHFQREGVNVDYYLKHAIGGVLLLVAVVILAKTFLPLPETTITATGNRRKLMIAGWGALVGVAVGITSIGSGTLMTPFLLALFPKSPYRVVGTDVFHGAILVITTALLYTHAGKVEWSLIPTLLAGSIPGVLLGSYFAGLLPVRGLRVSLGILLFATGVRLV